MFTPTTIEDLQASIRGSARVAIQGAGTKSALATASTHSTRGLSGITEHDPQEFTITALAGTPVREVVAHLAAHAQYLPFDPPLVDAGATIGGAIASGVSGPGRLRYGGVRDFLIAVRFVDGMGTLLRGGARVVKNAAGFDLPKLLVGSRGAYGAIVEASFKVFPRPPASTTLAIDYASHGDALRAFLAMGALPGELDCLDWLPPARVVLRVSGRAEALPARIARLTTAAGGHVQQVVGADEAQHWRHVREGLWVPPGWSWVTVACAPSQVEAIEAAAVTMIAHAPRRYLSGGHQLWMAWPDGEQDRFGRWLAARGLPARALTGPCRVGRPDAESELGVRLRRALDPRNIFGRGGGDAT